MRVRVQILDWAIVSFNFFSGFRTSLFQVWCLWGFLWCFHFVFCIPWVFTFDEGPGSNPGLGNCKFKFFFPVSGFLCFRFGACGDFCGVFILFFVFPGFSLSMMVRVQILVWTIVRFKFFYGFRTSLFQVWSLSGFVWCFHFVFFNCF